MFEAKFVKGATLKKIVEGLKDIVKQVNWNCTSDGISLQAMDESHVALVSVKLNADAFESFRCDRNIVLGLDVSTMLKIMKCASNDDSITLRAEEKSDTVIFIFESSNEDRTSQYEVKLMDVDDEQLGIPDTQYNAVVKMSSTEFQRICRDLSQIGDSVTIACTKNGVTFSTSGDIGNGKVNLRQNSSIDDEDSQVLIELQEAIMLTFAGRFLNIFCRACAVSSRVILSLKSESPLVLEFPMEEKGSMKYYLAPKLDDDEMQTQSTQDES